MQKVYSRINWENDPSTETPLSEDNLNKIDYALDKIDDRVVQLAGYEERAKDSETNAKTSEDNAKESELKAKEYAEQAQESAENVGDLIVPKGDITFEELSTVNAQTGYMYKITNDFYTDDTFADGSGQFYLGGTKVYLNKNGLWELLTSTSGGGSGTNDIAIPLLIDDWVANDDGTYSQKVYVAGLSADANVLIVPSPIGSTFTKEELEAYNCLTSNVLIEVGYMTFTAKEIPSMSFTVVAQGTSATGDAVATVTGLVAKVSELESEIDANASTIAKLNSDKSNLDNLSITEATNATSWGGMSFATDKQKEAYSKAKLISFELLNESGSLINTITIPKTAFKNYNSPTYFVRIENTTLWAQVYYIDENWINVIMSENTTLRVRAIW